MRFTTPSGRPPRALVAGTIGVLAVLIATAPLLDVDTARLASAIPHLLAFAAHLWVMPDWAFVPTLLRHTLETLEMTLVATSIAVLLSMPMVALAARNVSPHPMLFHAARAALSLTRALPELVWALVFVSAVGLGPLPGVLALALVTVGFMGKLFAEALEVVDIRAVEGVAAHGARPLQVLGFAILPQALPDLVGGTLYTLDHNLRAATILGLVGAGGIGFDLVMAMRMFEYDRLLPITIVILVCVVVLDRVSDRLRSRIVHG